MTARLLGTWEDRSPEWLAARQTGVGGSDIPIIMGWSPYKTRSQLLADKLGQTEPKPTTKAQARGIYLEDGIRRWLCANEGVELDPNQSAGMWCADDDDRLRYSPDGVTTDGRLIEIKCPEYRDEEHGWGRAGKKSDRIPLHYRAQIVWGLGILGLDDCLVGVLSGQPRFEFARYRVSADPDSFDYLRTQALRFLDDLEQQRNTSHERAAA